MTNDKTHGLGSVQRDILTVLASRGGEATRAQIEAGIATKNEQAMYGALNSLMRRGLIERERHPRPQPSIYRLMKEA